MDRVRRGAILGEHALPRGHPDPRPGAWMEWRQEQRGARRTTRARAGPRRAEAWGGGAADRRNAESSDPGEISATDVCARPEAKAAAGESGRVGAQCRSAAANGYRVGRSALGRPFDA